KRTRLPEMALLPADEGEDGLRRGVGLGERGGAGLLEDLQLDDLHLLLGEVGVGDAAARGFVVVHRRREVLQLERQALLVVADGRQARGDGRDGGVDGGDRRRRQGGGRDGEGVDAQAGRRGRVDRGRE